MRLSIRLLITGGVTLIIGLFILPTKTQAGFTSIFPTSGLDASGDSAANLNATDSARLASVDSQLITTSDWPDGAYDENKYIQFDFDEDFSFGADAVITDVRVTLSYRVSNNNLAAAKLKIYEYDTDSWRDEPIGVPGTANVDTTFATGNLASYINTANDLNNLSVRFLAYDHSSTTTSFNQVNIDITYSGTVTNAKTVSSSGATLPAAGSNQLLFLATAGLTLVVIGCLWWKNPELYKILGG